MSDLAQAYVLESVHLFSLVFDISEELFISINWLILSIFCIKKFPKSSAKSSGAVLWKQHLRRFTQQRLSGAKQVLLIWTVPSYEISMILTACAIHNKRCVISRAFESAKVLVGFCSSPFPFRLLPCPYSTLNLTVKPWQALSTDNHFLLCRHMLVQKRC